MLDLINFFSGPFTVYKSLVSYNFWKYDVEDDAFAIMRNKKNVMASIHSTAIQWQHRFRLEINLEKGSLELNGILSGSKSYGRESISISKVKTKKYKNKIERKVIYFKKDYSWKEEISDFANIIKYNKKIYSGNSNDALEVMKMISKIYKNVIGIDSSNKVIEKNILKKKEKHLNFINDDLSNPQKLEKFINEKLSQSDLNIFYGRFFLHAVDENIENIFLNLFKNLNYKNNLLALEFRTSKDEFLEKEFNNHYRRYIDIKNFKKKLKNFDIKIKYFTEGQGYAKFKSDDAYVARVIAY